MKFVFFEVKDWQKEAIQQAFPQEDLVFFAEPLSSANVTSAQGAQVLGVFVQSRVTKEVIDQLPELKLIATFSTGYDHIDCEYAKNKRVFVANVPNYGENTVAEHTFALILALSRRLMTTYERTESLDFCIDDSIQGIDLKDKTIGIYGLGSIGNYVAKIAHGLSMRIVAYKRTPDPELTRLYGVEFVNDLQSLLKQSDVVTLHCPLTPETEHLINNETIKYFKKGAIFINTARGGLVDTTALLQALDEGILSAAGLDVLEGENDLIDPVDMLSNQACDPQRIRQMVEDHLLVKRDNVIITPHNAFNTREAVNRILQTSIENINRFFVGNSQNIVNPDW